MIDIEVAHATPSPTIDPSVHTILIGHSMGGIVAAETLLLLVNEQPLPPTTSSADHTTGSLSPTSFMFPHIQGLLAFDTPFLGIAPSVIAHGAEGYSKKATHAYSAISEFATGLGWGAKSEPNVAHNSTGTVAGALPSPSSAADAAAAIATIATPRNSPTAGLRAMLLRNACAATPRRLNVPREGDKESQCRT